MQTFWSYLTDHWLSISLIAGVLLAAWYVYRNKDKYIRGWSDK